MRKIALIGLALTVLAVAMCFLQPGEAFAVRPDEGGPGSSNPVTVDVCKGDDACNSFINKYINPFIVLLSAVVGIAAVISIIIAGIQYASSADDPGAVSKAKQRIFNTILGLVAYAFLFAFLNYLIPGGILP